MPYNFGLICITYNCRVDSGRTDERRTAERSLDRGRATRRRLIEVTARLSAERQGGELSVAEIAAAAQVFPSQVTYYFGSKDSLVVHAAFLALLHDTRRIERIGHRIHGDHGQRVKGAGYEYAHVAIDDHSRVAYVEVLPDQQGGTTAGFFTRARQWFAQRGVVVRRILTDNGGGYRSHHFTVAVQRARVRHRWCRPYRPQTNGKAERFIQTLQREWAYARPFTTSARRTRALAAWLRYYNTQRPHTALDYQPPCVRLPRAAQ